MFDNFSIIEEFEGELVNVILWDTVKHSSWTNLYFANKYEKGFEALITTTASWHFGSNCQSNHQLTNH